MSMILYERSDCPFCWKVRLAMHFAGVKPQRIPVASGEKNPDVVRLNPAGSVPVMVDGDLVLAESAIIAEYINEACADGALLPGDAAAHARIRQLAAYSDTQVGKALRGLVFERRAKPEAEQDQQLIKTSETAWRQCLDWLEERLPGDVFVERFSLAECALLPRFALAERYGAGVDARHPKLHAWWQLDKAQTLEAV